MYTSCASYNCKLEQYAKALPFVLGKTWPLHKKEESKICLPEDKDWPTPRLFREYCDLFGQPVLAIPDCTSTNSTTDRFPDRKEYLQAVVLVWMRMIVLAISVCFPHPFLPFQSRLQFALPVFEQVRVSV